MVNPGEKTVSEKKWVACVELAKHGLKVALFPPRFSAIDSKSDQSRMALT